MNSALDMYMYLIAAIVLIGAIATVMIGVSKQNKEENPTYDRKTKEYMIRLTWIYTVSIIASAIALYFVFK